MLDLEQFLARGGGVAAVRAVARVVLRRPNEPRWPARRPRRHGRSRARPTASPRASYRRLIVSNSRSIAAVPRRDPRDPHGECGRYRTRADGSRRFRASAGAPAASPLEPAGGSSGASSTVSIRTIASILPLRPSSNVTSVEDELLVHTGIQCLDQLRVTLGDERAPHLLGAGELAVIRVELLVQNEEALDAGAGHARLRGEVGVHLLDVAAHASRRREGWRRAPGRSP